MMNNEKKNRWILLAVLILSGLSVYGQTGNAPSPTRPVLDPHQSLFPKGTKITSDNFTGEVWVNMLVQADTAFTATIGNVTFAPGSRSNWHRHPSGQILLVTNGVGYYQEKGTAIRLIRKGDVIKCPPDIEHWHGASPDSSMSHVALGPDKGKGAVVWLRKVTDEEYHQFIR